MPFHPNFHAGEKAAMPDEAPSNSIDVFTLLRKSRLCDALTDDQVRHVAEHVELQPFKAGEQLGSSGEEVTHLFILADGQIKASTRNAKGQEILVAYMNPGDHAGDVPLLESSPRPVDLTALADGNLLRLSAASFHSLIDAYPRMLRNLFRTLGARFKEFAGVLKRGIPSPVLGIVGIFPSGNTLCQRLIARLAADGERLTIWSNDPERLKLDSECPRPRRLDEPAVAEIERFRHDRSAELERHVMVLIADSWSNVDPRWMRLTNEMLWLVSPPDESIANECWREFTRAAAESADLTRLVWLLGPSDQVAPRSESWRSSRREVKVPIETDGNSMSLRERQGLDRLVRALKGYSLGLALAGGGARGLAHLGVLHAFDEAGITFDIMAGTSCGAMAGITYAAGMPTDAAVEAFGRDLKPSRWFRALPKGQNWYLLTQFRRGNWDGMLRRYLHDWRLEQLPTPFLTLTVDLISAREVVRDRGDAAHAILESINLPGISRPIMRDGMALVDGGVLNNLPADVLSNRGADFIVGVDVTSRLRHELGGNRRDTPPDRVKAVGTVDTLLRVFETQAHGLGNIRSRAVDFWISPDTAAFDFADFTRAREIAAAGESATQQVLPQLRVQLAELQRKLRSR